MKKSVKVLTCSSCFNPLCRLAFLAVFLLMMTACGKPGFVASPSSYRLSGATQSGNFDVERVQLELASGINRQSLSRGTVLSPTAVIKFRGRGLFQARWLLDQQIIEQLNISLDHGSVLSLSPTQPIDTVSLSPGEHRIVLQIINPPPAFQSPGIHFFLVD